MAITSLSFFSYGQRILQNISFNKRLTLIKYQYSMFPPHFVKPITERSKINELDESDLESMKFQSFLPASVSENASVFYDATFEWFVNRIMSGGNKATCRELMEQTFYQIKKAQFHKYHEAETDEIRESIELNPEIIFHTAVDNCTPLIKVRPVTKGANVYQVPTALTRESGRTLAVKWLIQASRDKGTRVTLSFQLAKELIDAYNLTGRVVNKKRDLHKLCEANRAYMHYR